jgi:hypothetical protein
MPLTIDTASLDKDTVSLKVEMDEVSMQFRLIINGEDVGKIVDVGQSSAILIRDPAHALFKLLQKHFNF